MVTSNRELGLLSLILQYAAHQPTLPLRTPQPTPYAPPRYGSELFGNIIGIGKTKDQQAKGEKRSASPVLAREEAVARLKMDFDRFYFVTGQMDLDLYEEDCTFADPFVAFQGRQRFKVGAL